MDIVVNQFNDRYLSDGYQAKLISYDILSKKNSVDFFSGWQLQRLGFSVWNYARFAIANGSMFYFQHQVSSSHSVDEGSVVLRLSRHDGDE